VPAAPAIAPGQPKVVSIPDLAEKQLLGRNAPAELPLGCSGVAASRVIVVRDSVEETIPDVDQMLYVVAGEATLKLGDSEQSITPGWFSIIPRGMRYSLVRKGRNPMIALSILAGPACPPPSTRAPSR
jgi:mannose-6-phosphate isomerase-like protein (cupin superfamily)